MDGDNKRSWPPARQERATARVVLGLITAYVVIAALVVPAVAQSPSPSPTSSPTGSPTASPPPSGEPAIALLNPAAGYDPGLPQPPREPDEPDPPKVSDRFDGVNSTYHIVAWVKNPPPNAIVEAYFQRGTDNEITIGTMQRVPGSPDTWELEWDISGIGDDTSNPTQAAAVIKARLFQLGPGGPEEVAADEVTVEMESQDPPVGSQDTRPADETVEITWPTNHGALGFYKPRGGQWRAAIFTMLSDHTSELNFWYSTSDPGDVPEYVECGHGLAFQRQEFLDEPIPLSGTCTLQSGDLPIDVTAVAAVTEEADKSDRSDAFVTREELTQDSADAHRVQPYVQTPGQMKISIEAEVNGQVSVRQRRPTGSANCLAYVAFVTDQLDRPVQGANVDVHIQGPTDQLQLANDTTTGSAGATGGGFQPPDKGHSSTESGRSCENGNPLGVQADHNVPGGPDRKHRESTAGTGISSGINIGGGCTACLTPGAWRFWLSSQQAGITDITAWVDDEELIGDLTANREADNDVLDPGEPTATSFAQWLSSPMTVTLDPAGATAPAGSCTPFTAKVRAGNAVIAGINVDLHATGPDSDLDFCSPTGATPRRAPDKQDHQAEDSEESSHAAIAPDPPTQHTEGETDGEGNFVVGLVSPVTGDTTLQVWIDGEPGFDDDDPTGNTSVLSTISWASATGDAEVSFINPSGYGPGPGTGATGTGDNISGKLDADLNYHIVTRVDAPALVPGVEILLGTGGNFTLLGEASRVGNTDVYEFSWNLANVTDGSHTLQARIKGTSIVEERTVTVNNVDSMDPDPNEAPLETVEIAKPLNGSIALFSKGVTEVQGIASSGAEGVDLWYTKAPAKDTPEKTTGPVGSRWILCGYQDLNPGANPQPFTAKCTLVAPDQAAQVTAIAVHTYDCVQNNCDASHPGPPPNPNVPNPRAPGRNESGDAHRVFGLEGSPVLSIEPPEVQNNIDTCQKIVLAVKDVTGQPISNTNVDVHVTGPADDVALCDPDDGSATPRRPPDQGGHTDGVDPNGSLHTEGETLPNGRFIFGVTSDGAGDTFIEGWIDGNDNDVKDGDETADTSVLHWRIPGGCDILGTAGDDRLVGTSANERICGLGGDDVIKGKGGRDVLIGGPGDDELFGGKGNDKLRGRSGNDVLEGQGGDDNLKGGKGRDTLRGGRGDDHCDGGPGKDRVSGCESGSPNRRFSPI